MAKTYLVKKEKKYWHKMGSIGVIVYRKKKVFYFDVLKMQVAMTHIDTKADGYMGIQMIAQK